VPGTPVIPSAGESGVPSAQSIIHKIVLTGGPCGGKTTAQSLISERLLAMGYAVYRVPEVATLTIMSGANPSQMKRAQFVTFEENLLKLQIAMEDSFEVLAQSNDKTSTVILYAIL
jgi:hypothetical protein